MKLREPDEYHLIDIVNAISRGGFATLEAARLYARQEGIEAWDIWHGDQLVERHDPRPQEPS